MCIYICIPYCLIPIGYPLFTLLAFAFSGPQATRPPALLCTMNGLLATSVALSVTENTKSACPAAVVLLYLAFDKAEWGIANREQPIRNSQ